MPLAQPRLLSARSSLFHMTGMAPTGSNRMPGLLLWTRTKKRRCSIAARRASSAVMSSTAWAALGSWHRHVTCSMLALAFLTVQRAHHPEPEPDAVPQETPEQTDEAGKARQLEEGSPCR